MQTGGRGFLGFASIRTEDIQNKLLTITDYRQDYPYIGRPSMTTVQVLPSVIADPCLVNPLHPQFFEELPDNCGPVICPIAESRTPMREASAGFLQRISSAPVSKQVARNSDALSALHQSGIRQPRTIYAGQLLAVFQRHQCCRR